MQKNQEEITSRVSLTSFLKRATVLIALLGIGQCLVFPVFLESIASKQLISRTDYSQLENV